MLPHRVIASAFACVLLTCACSVAPNFGAAEAEVSVFHSRLDAGEAARIYAASSPELKAASSEADFVALLNAVHTKLGATVSSKREDAIVTYTPSGKQLKLRYKTEYVGGIADEDFIFFDTSGGVQLAKYRVYSLPLITK